MHGTEKVAVNIRKGHRCLSISRRGLNDFHACKPGKTVVINLFKYQVNYIFHPFFTSVWGITQMNRKPDPGSLLNWCSSSAGIKTASPCFSLCTWPLEITFPLPPRINTSCSQG